MAKKKQLDEDYPGQKHEGKLYQAIHKAVETADRIILDASDGSIEETDWLTLKVAEAFFNKVGCGINRMYIRKQFEGRIISDD